MRRETAKRYLHLINAFSAGAVLQYRNSETGAWFDTENPDFTAHEYRVKPEPKIEFHIAYADVGSGGVWIGSLVHQSLAAAQAKAAKEGAARHIIQTTSFDGLIDSIELVLLR